MDLAGYSPWGCEESDMTEATEHTHLVESVLCFTSSLGNGSLGMGLRVEHGQRHAHYLKGDFFELSRLKGRIGILLVKAAKLGV